MVETPMKKAELAAQMIERRIAHADHVLAGLPSERQLAEELGLSRNTVRAAVQYLLKKGVLVRRENGRLDVGVPENGPKQRTVGFLASVEHAADMVQWRVSAQGTLEGYPATLRAVSYAHWGDPVILEALAAFDAVYFVAPAERIPEWLVAKMKEPGCRVVVLDQDESDVGLPSVTLFPPAMEVKLFEHLVRLGHRRIDCLNTQQRGAIIQGRIAVWREYIQQHGLAGELIALERRRPVESAYEVIRDSLRAGHPLGSALFCTTGPAAIGAMRALHEAGLRIGNDISVCAVNSEGLGRYMMPSLTALESPPRALFLRQPTEWMLGEGGWTGPLLVQPQDIPFFKGESTGPAPASPVVSLVSTWRGMVGQSTAGHENGHAMRP